MTSFSTLTACFASFNQNRSLIKRGDHIIYSSIGNIGNKDIKGGIGIKFVAVSDRYFTIEVLPRKIPFMNRARINFPFDGNDLADLGGIVSGWSVLLDGQLLGKETVPTPFGDRALEHYMKNRELREWDAQDRSVRRSCPSPSISGQHEREERRYSILYC